MNRRKTKILIISFIILFILIISLVIHRFLYIKNHGWQLVDNNIYIHKPPKYLSQNIIEVWIKDKVVHKKPKDFFAMLDEEKGLDQLKIQKESDFNKLQNDNQTLKNDIQKGQDSIRQNGFNIDEFIIEDDRAQVNKDKFIIKQDIINIKNKILSINKIASKTNYVLTLFKFNCHNSKVAFIEDEYFSKLNIIYSHTMAFPYWFNIPPTHNNLNKIYKIICMN